ANMVSIATSAFTGGAGRGLASLGTQGVKAALSSAAAGGARQAASSTATHVASGLATRAAERTPGLESLAPPVAPVLSGVESLASGEGARTGALRAVFGAGRQGAAAMLKDASPATRTAVNLALTAAESGSIAGLDARAAQQPKAAQTEPAPAEKSPVEKPTAEAAPAAAKPAEKQQLTAADIEGYQGKPVDWKKAKHVVETGWFTGAEGGMDNAAKLAAEMDKAGVPHGDVSSISDPNPFRILSLWAGRNSKMSDQIAKQVLDTVHSAESATPENPATPLFH